MSEQLSLARMNEIATKMSNVPEGYPPIASRLKLADVALKNGRLVIPDGPWYMSDHPNRQGVDPALIDPEVPAADLAHLPEDITAGWQAAGQLLDQHGRPIRPHWRQLLGDPRTVLPTGLGRYYRYGLNLTVDAAAYRIVNEQTELLLIRRKQGGEWALPGGFLDRGEDAAAGARRELGEETGLDAVEGWEESILKMSPIGRFALLHAWTSNEVFLIHGNQDYLHDVAPVAGDDAIDVGWFTREGTQKLDIFSDHGTYIGASFDRIAQVSS